LNHQNNLHFLNAEMHSNLSDERWRREKIYQWYLCNFKIFSA